jgi:hypothetical protein
LSTRPSPSPTIVDRKKSFSFYDTEGIRTNMSPDQDDHQSKCVSKKTNKKYVLCGVIDSVNYLTIHINMEIQMLHMLLKKNRPLSTWMKSQRNQSKLFMASEICPMTIERIELLNELVFNGAALFCDSKGTSTRTC